MDFSWFKQQVFRRWRINLEGYKEKQLKRRIDGLMDLAGVSGYAEYLRLLEKDEVQRSRFFDKITINVSEFFRNPEVFQVMEREIIPHLLDRQGMFRVWSAACSNGAEPYSVAIIVDELGARGRCVIEGTDVDRNILKMAEAGRYDQSAVRNVSPGRLMKYFVKEDDCYILKDWIKKMVSFRHHDLLIDRYPQGYDLILCRNVTIYFNSDVQTRIYQQLLGSLKPGGVLCIGATESILRYWEIGFERISPWFYRRPLKKL